MGFLSGLLSLLTGGISNIFENGSWNNLGNVLNNAGNTANDIGNQNMLGNWVAKTTGSRLTDAEREANAFTAQREDLAWERQMQASNTSYQRQVFDMQAAGLNPMLALGAGGASSPSASTSGSVSPSGAGLNLGSLLQFALEAKLLPAKLANMVADTNVKSAEAEATRASTDLTKENTRGSQISNDFNEKYNKVKLALGEMEQKQASKNLELSESEIEKNKQWVRESEQRAEMYIEQIENSKDERVTRETVRAMYKAQARLANANADTVAIMREADKLYREAQTDTEKEKAAEIKLSAAYKQGLLDNGYIQALVKDLNASAKEKNASAKQSEQWIEESDIREALLKGDFGKLTDRGRLKLWADSL